MQAYSKHPKIQLKFHEKYHIKISFALHTGKAVQGPIGSEFKVDAVYLSTEMQVAMRMAQEAGILTIPGTFFGEDQEAYLRFAFANAGRDIIAALPERLAAL